ncbi:TlpA disulfide reductase family protein [Polycladidibacter stylochi]|uniref:TlpA disulfide reductase family protein n=1 Tax=Polycladidibacter stylochi TaxID=1807766 RepID=UPI000831BB65|nr:TlpA disulfide reductase family protein [Pseudovibrio stylochi]
MKLSSSSRNLKLGKALFAGIIVIAALGRSVFPANSQETLKSDQACELSLQAAKAIKANSAKDFGRIQPASKALTMLDLNFHGADGQPMDMTAFNGKTVLLNLWASWCAPCRKEMPDLHALQQKLGSDKFQVVAVNVDRRGDPNDFLKEVGAAGLPVYSDNSMGILRQLRSKTRARGLPSTVLIGEDGCEIGAMVGPAEWASDEAVALINEAVAAQK